MFETPIPPSPEKKKILPIAEQSSGELKQLHRGIWAEILNPNQSLPVGGSMFSNELTTKLQLDFEVFDEQLKNFTQENIRDAYEKSRPQILKWMEEAGSDIDPYTFFTCFQIQKKMHMLLGVIPDEETKSTEREKVYTDNSSHPRLSQLIGKTACAERAALGKYLCQQVGLESTYMSGVTMNDVKDEDEYPEDHSFLILKNSTGQRETLIFDIARAHAFDMPRILKTDIPFSPEVFENKEELLIGATETLSGTRKLWFGVGEPIAGVHKTSESSPKV